MKTTVCDIVDDCSAGIAMRHIAVFEMPDDERSTASVSDVGAFDEAEIAPRRTETGGF